jgi:hypothetical protein
MTVWRPPWSACSGHSSMMRSSLQAKPDVRCVGGAGGTRHCAARAWWMPRLAAIFHPDAPNDVAPSAYNEDDPAGEPPGSPLDPSPAPSGFRRAA